MFTKNKIIATSATGSILEWFDFAVYGYVAPYIADLFFPSSNKLASLLMTYSVFAIGFIVRPLSAMLFGYIGDHFGRKNALIYSSLLMAFPTFCLGMLPTYHEIGIGAPLLLVLCRLIQGLAIGGEFTGSFIYLYEQAPFRHKAKLSCIGDIGCALGMILGLAFVAFLHNFLTEEQFFSYGWRIPFLSGIFLAIVGLYMRLSLSETPDFLNDKKMTDNHFDNPIVLIAKENKLKMLTTMLFLTFYSFGFYLFAVFIPNQMATLGKINASNAYLISILFLSVKTFAIFYSAKLSDKTSRWKIIAAAQSVCFLLAYPMFYALTHWNIEIQLTLLCLFGFSLGCCFGPRASFLSETFPVAIRYSSIAIALNLVTAIFGGTAPFLATYLVAKTGIIEAPAILIIVSALVSYVALFLLQKDSASQEEYQLQLEN